MSYSPITAKEIRQIMEENVFVRSRNSYYASDGDPCVDWNNDFNVARYTSLEGLKKAFLMYDCLRQCFVYKSLVFVNQTLGGGWEAWTLKKFGDELIPFESISMGVIIREGSHKGETFEEYIESLLKLSRCQVINYMKCCLRDDCPCKNPEYPD